MGKYGRWQNAGERKGLRVNVDRTKGMQLLFGKKNSVSLWYEMSEVGSSLLF